MTEPAEEDEFEDEHETAADGEAAVDAPAEEPGEAGAATMCSMHRKVEALYRCKACLRHLCQVCAKGSKKGICRRCVDKRNKQKQGFCDECIATSSPESSMNAVTVNGVGFAFFGESNACQRCRSVDRTLWFCVLLPVIPIATYKFLHVGQSGLFGNTTQFVSRKVPLNPAHVRFAGILWAIALSLIGLVALIVVMRR